MANIINLTADTTVDLDIFRLNLFFSMNSSLERAFKDFSDGHDTSEKYCILMSASTEMYNYLHGVQALLFAIPEYNILSNSFAYETMSDAIESVARELADLAREINR